MRLRVWSVLGAIVLAVSARPVAAGVVCAGGTTCPCDGGALCDCWLADCNLWCDQVPCSATCEAPATCTATYDAGGTISCTSNTCSLKAAGNSSLDCSVAACNFALGDDSLVSCAGQCVGSVGNRGRVDRELYSGSSLTLTAGDNLVATCSLPGSCDITAGPSANLYCFAGICVFRVGADAGVACNVPCNVTCAGRCTVTSPTCAVTCLGGTLIPQDGGVCGCTATGGPDAGVDAGSPDAGSPDAGSPDAGSADAGSTDAGVTDAGVTDAGVTDAGFTDAGVTDAGSTDAGSTDAGSTDAGFTDAGSTDAGSTDAGFTDAGSTDAGSTDAGSTDAGSTDAGTQVTAQSLELGCGCRTGSGLPFAALISLLAWGRWRRQRDHLPAAHLSPP